MSYLKLRSFTPLVGPTTIAQQPNHARNRVVGLEHDLVAFHADPTIFACGESIDISNMDYIQIVKEAKLTRKLPKSFFSDDGQLKDTALIRKTLVRLAEDPQYVNSHQSLRQEVTITEDSIAADLARILLNSIPDLAADINKLDWADDPTSPQHRPANHFDWQLRNSVLQALHSDDPSQVWVGDGVTTSTLNRIRADMKSSPLFYIAHSALKLLGSEKTAPIFIRFVNNLKLNVNIQQES